MAGYQSIFTNGNFAPPTKSNPLVTGFTPGQYGKINAQIAAQPKFNINSVNDVPTLNAALKSGQINSNQWTQRFNQIKAQAPKPKTGLFSSLGNELNKIVVKPAEIVGKAVVNTAKSIPNIAEGTVNAAGQIGPDAAIIGSNVINKAIGKPQVTAQQLKNIKTSNVGQTAKTFGATGSKKQLVGDVAQTALLAASPETDALGEKVAAKVLPKAIAKVAGRTAANTAVGYGFGASGAAAQGANLKQINKAGLQNAALGGGLTLGGSALAKGISKAGETTDLAQGKAPATIKDLIQNTRAQNLQTALEKAKQPVPIPRSALDNHIAPEPSPVLLSKSPAEISTPVTGKNIVSKAEQGSVQKPNIATPKATTSLNESGGLPIGEVQNMINKHQAVTKATGDISEDFNKVKGNTSDIKLDVAKSLKNRAPLSVADKQTIQDFRDAKATGTDVPELPARLQAANDNITALNKAAQTADAEKARLGGQEQLAQKIESRNPESYTHRVAQDKGSSLELAVRGDRNNPLSINSLSKTTASSKKRNYMAITDEDGNRQVANIQPNKRVKLISNGGKTTEDLGSLGLKANADRMLTELKPTQNKIDALEKEQQILSSTKSRSVAASKRLANIKTNLQDAYREHADISNKYDMNDLENKSFIGKDGKKYTLGQATTKEITKNTGQKYYIDPELTTHLNYADSQVSLHNTRFVEQTKQILEDKNLAVKNGEGTPPKGFEETTNQYFRGYKLDPKIAEVLDDIGTKKSNVVGGIANKVSNVLRQTIVYLPIKHDFNELAGYAIDRGLSKWVNPVAYGRMGKSLVTAAKEVATQGPLYRQILREGGHLVTADDSQLGKVVAKQVKQLSDNPKSLEQFAKSFGIKAKNAYPALQKVTVWDVQDILNIARVHERMQGTIFTKPMSLQDALKATEKTNLQYKLPSRIALPGKAGRAVKETLGSDKVYFGRYAYDKYRIAKNIAKGTVNLKHPVEAVRSADQLAATVAIAAILWPLVDKGVQKITGDPNAHVTAPGVSSVAEVINQVRKGEKGATAAAGSQLSIAAPYTIGAQLLGNKDSFTGNNIHDPNATTAQKSTQTLKWLFTQISPEQKLTSSKNIKANKTLGTALGLAGVSTPKNSPLETKLNSLEYDSLPGVQSQARSLGAKGNTLDAQKVINQYNAKVLAVAIADLKSKGQPVPDNKTLFTQLKKSKFIYQPKPTTIKGWSKPKKAVTGAFQP